jgi:hypothetical protein
VFSAARDGKNNILQPEELNSEGTYSLRASVPSPVINALCVSMDKEELRPIVYDTWNDQERVNVTSWTPTGLMSKATTTNKTKVDDIFEWTHDNPINYPPVFARYPKPFNTIMNHTSYPWGRAAIYLLGQGGPADDGTNMTGVFSLCKISMAISPDCTTLYKARSGGGSMDALCEHKADDMAYSKLNPGTQWKRNVANWRDIGTDWSNSLSLNTGLVDGDASNSRLLTQLMLRPTNPDPKNLEVDLSTTLPSMGEALAVMAGCTLLKAMVDAPYTMFWVRPPSPSSPPHPTKPLQNYTVSQIDDYNASLKAQQYASGGVDNHPADKAWFVILVLVFLLNIFVLVYFILHRGLVTDFSEPPNLFALAVNSPPSHVLAGSCGGGPEGRQYGM